MGICRTRNVSRHFISDDVSADASFSIAAIEWRVAHTSFCRLCGDSERAIPYRIYGLGKRVNCPTQANSGLE
jgi:hypothetical protein